jgi:hypothetical protein
VEEISHEQDSNFLPEVFVITLRLWQLQDVGQVIGKDARSFVSELPSL